MYLYTMIHQPPSRAFQRGNSRPDHFRPTTILVRPAATPRQAGFKENHVTFWHVLARFVTPFWKRQKVTWPTGGIVGAVVGFGPDGFSAGLVEPGGKLIAQAVSLGGRGIGET